MTVKVTREVVKTTEVTKEYDDEQVYVVGTSPNGNCVLISSNKSPANYNHDAETIRSFLRRAIPAETYRTLKEILSNDD